ncbi:MAG: hypothetical protein NWR99_10620 [Verrucomicrobiales bacterium]|nr:hypothetical protein [Verrucomicrobiales bacterium]
MATRSTTCSTPPGVVVTEVEYLTRIGDRHLAGVKANAPISDHAAMRFRIVVAG